MDRPSGQRDLLRLLVKDKSSEEIEDLVVELSEENIELKAKLVALADRLADLEERLGLDSNNSGKPPSSNPPWTKPPKAKRRKSGKKKGGQKGRKGKNRKRVPPDQVDERVVVHPAACGDCGGQLVETDLAPRRHQVWDLPEEIRALVTEYELHSGHCPCCVKTTEAELPQGAPDRAFGARVQSLVAYLSGALRLSDRQVKELLGGAFGLEISVGSVANLRKDIGAALAEPMNEILDHVRNQEIVHADETSWRQEEERPWLWVAATESAAAFRILYGRGRIDAEDLLGADFSGTAVTDRLYSYNWIGSRQLCWAHLIRDFRRIAGRVGLPGRLGRQLLELGEEMLRQWRRVRDGKLAHSSFRTYASRYRCEIRELLEAGRHCGHKRTAGTCRTILKVESQMWTFLRDPAIPPTNNAAERALRHAVIWRKVRHGTQSKVGTRFVERVLTAVATLRLQGRNVLTTLADTITAWLSGEPAPSYLPA